MQNFRKNILLPVADKIMDTSLLSSYKLIRRLQNCSRDEIRDWQYEKLKKLLHHCYNNSSFYNTVFTNLGILPDDIRSTEDLDKLPVLSKEEIRNNFNDIIPQNLNDFKYKKSATGGSTGDPLVYFLDYNSWSMSNANNLINWEKLGYRYGDKYIALGSTSLNIHSKNNLAHKIYYQLKGKIGLNGINMADEICDDYINFLVKHRIQYIYGYASSVFLLAKYVITRNLKLDIKACFTTSEVLTELYSSTISEAFNCKIMDCYGANDGGLTAYAEEIGFYKVGYNCLVQQDSADDNGIGAILVTDLTNYSMPFINYKLGDEIQVDETRNRNYDYNGQIINKVLGRSSDILFLKNGRVLTGPGFTVLFKNIPVEYYCIEKTAADSLICWLIKLPAFNNEHEKIIVDTLKQYAGEGTLFNFKYIRNPFLNKAGKRQYFMDSSSEKTE